MWQVRPRSGHENRVSLSLSEKLTETPVEVCRQTLSQPKYPSHVAGDCQGPGCFWGSHRILPMASIQLQHLGSLLSKGQFPTRERERAVLSSWGSESPWPLNHTVNPVSTRTSLGQSSSCTQIRPIPSLTVSALKALLTSGPESHPSVLPPLCSACPEQNSARKDSSLPLVTALQVAPCKRILGTDP